MNFIADEGVEREIVDGLRAQGHQTKISENSYSGSNEFIRE